MLRGEGDDTPWSFTETARSGRLALAWTTRRLAHRPMTETRLTAEDLAGAAPGWLRALRGRFDVLDAGTEEVLRSRLAVDDADPYEIALLIEVARARSFDVDELVADQLMVWTEGGARSWNGFEAILTLLTDWVVP